MQSQRLGLRFGPLLFCGCAVDGLEMGGRGGGAGAGGCGGRGFHAEGMLTSRGGRLETWSWRPQGCVRGVDKDGRVASLLWIDPVRRDASRANQHQFTVEDAPVRLDLSQVGGEPVAVLETVRTEGTEFNGRNCGTLTLETHEGGPTLREGRGSLGGRLRMDCEVRGQHVTAEIKFEGCDY